MVRTGQRAAALMTLLVQAGFRPKAAPRAPRLHEVSPDIAGRVLEIYAEFGGTVSEPQLRPGGWDIFLEGDLAVELDEELHFNRYRGMTLEPDWTMSLPWREEYCQLAVSHEAVCLRAGQWGKRWTNESCEKMFGPAGAPGDFDDGGAPRWKQRALYDAVNDAAALSCPGVRLARVSVFDRIDGVEVSSLLDGSRSVAPELIANFVKRRTRYAA